MLLVNGQAGQSMSFFVGPGGGVAYTLYKGDGTVAAGAGVITNTVLAGQDIAAIGFTAGELNANGPLGVWVTDAGGQLNGDQACVVPALPGGLDPVAVRAAIGLAAANLDSKFVPLSTLTAAGVRAAIGLASANLDAQLAGLTPLSAAAIRAAVGLATANLDGQLAAIGPRWTGAETRAAIGLASANLDAQLAAIGLPMTPAGIRAAIGLAIANLDAQFAAIGPTGTSPSGIRAALGVAKPNLDQEIQARNEALDALLERFPLPEGSVIGGRR